MVGRTARGMAAGVALALAWAAQASAQSQTSTAQLTVTATVQSSCSVTGGTLAFGTYNSGQPSALDAEGAISYTNCPANSALTIELDNGLNAQGGQRRLRSGSNYLNYEIYKTAARSTRWGTGSEALGYQVLAGGNGTIPVYGRIFANQNVPAGSYSDTVTITLRF